MQSLPVEDWKTILNELAVEGVKKVNFAGGEPTLSPFLTDLIKHAKSLGMITSIISNGFGITREFLDLVEDSLDIVGLSIDSSNESIQQYLGRGDGNHVEHIRILSSIIQEYNLFLKINTVVTALTWREDMNSIIQDIRPNRWKVFQFLPVEGQNDLFAQSLSLSQTEFIHFLNIHKRVSPVSENNDLMSGSYCMIDPTSRIYQNANGSYIHSKPILERGFINAIREVGFNEEKFFKRSGYYGLKTRK